MRYFKYRGCVALGFALAVSACGGGGSNTATIAQAQNSAPVAGTTAFTVAEDSDLSATLTATDADSDALTFTKASDPAQGSVTSFAANGAFVYRPRADFSGSDSFSVRVADTAGNSVAATLNITVSPVNDAPTVRNDFFRLAASDSLALNVLANDSDPENDSLTVTIDQQPIVGTATVSGGIVNLALPAGFKGFTRFGYRAADTAGAGQVASVVVFFGIEPFHVVYETDEEQGARILYQDNLLARRAISIVGGQRKVVGRFETAATGQLVVFDECIATCGTGETPQIGNIYAVPAEETGVARVVNHSLPAGERILYRSRISPDGNWLAYATTDASNAVRLHVANLTPTGTATQVPLPPNRALSSNQSTTLSVGASSLYVYFPLTVSQTFEREIYRAELSNPTNVSRPTNSINVDFVATNATETAIFQGVTSNFNFNQQKYLERVAVADPATAAIVSPDFFAAPNAAWYFSDDRQRLVFLSSLISPFQPPTSTTVWSGDPTGVNAPQSVATINGLVPAVRVTAFNPGGSRVLVNGSGGLFDVGLSQGSQPAQISPSSPTSCDQECSRYDSSGNFVAYAGSFTPAGQPTTLGIWRADRSAPANQTLILGFVPSDIRYSPDGNALATIEAGPNNQGLRLFLRNMTAASPPLQLTGVINPNSSTFEAEFLRRP
jgi:hypothetical protein